VRQLFAKCKGDKSQLKSTYRTLSLKFHPDKIHQLMTSDLEMVGIINIKVEEAEHVYIVDVMSFTFRTATETYDLYKEGNPSIDEFTTKPKSGSESQPKTKHDPFADPFRDFDSFFNSHFKKESSESSKQTGSGNKKGASKHKGPAPKPGVDFEDPIYGTAWICGDCGATVNAFTCFKECPCCGATKGQCYDDFDEHKWGSDDDSVDSFDLEEGSDEYLSKDFRTYLIGYEFLTNNEYNQMRKKDKPALRKLYNQEVENFEFDMYQYPEFYGKTYESENQDSM
ncbi:hypothetical protein YASMINEVIRUS_38, partial [Yasminevirus sp. GU-2018]